MKRFSVLYLLNEHFHHIGCRTQAEAESLLQRLLMDSRRIPVGIYDAKTELFAWEPLRQRAYNQSGIGEQGKLGDQIITIAEALRHGNSSGQSLVNVQKTSFFA
ncbi:hypothetical protein [Spirosoma validum]|uniref:Uncharacterized protein n=1 Tax=Spirosoma validum TaxID=2771355 RepID=A0A927GFQ3_9BACT|nr:hypothetical protein [Spirosoma validum]MBD2756054.1 hypothetical protein [Spirosoma validum]